MNLYDKIKSPIETDENLINLINIYSKLKDTGHLDNMYSYITQNNEFSESETQLYEDKFFKYIVEPSVQNIAQQFKDGSYIRTNDSFSHLFIEEDMQAMFEEKSVEDIIKRGREIEAKDTNTFKDIDKLFWKYGNQERKEIYKEFLQKKGINLDSQELFDWLDYRAVMEEFQDPISMGFHLHPTLESEKIKLYIDAGADTYELASMFKQKSENKGIPSNFKVSCANVTSELTRNDKLCIYIDDLNLLPQYIEILENIKDEKPEFNMQSPMPTVGNIDNWIGIGTDSIQNSSYNMDICNIITQVCNKYLGNYNQTQINQLIQTDPNILNRIRQDMQQMCVNQGKSYEKMCVNSNDENTLKSFNLEKDKVDISTLEQFAKNITPENINEKNMQFLYENGYTGSFNNPNLNIIYQLYCDNQKKNNQIKVLKTKEQTQKDVIKYDSELINNLTSEWGGLINSLSHIRNSLDENKKYINCTKQGIDNLDCVLNQNQSKSRLSKLIDKIKNKFPNTLRLEASTQSENLKSFNTMLSSNITDILNSLEKEFNSNIRKSDTLTTELNQRQEMLNSNKHCFKNLPEYQSNKKTNTTNYSINFDQYITPKNITQEKLQFLYENHYSEMISNPVLSMAYKLYCENREKDSIIEKLEKTTNNNDKVIEYDSGIINHLKYTIQNVSLFKKDILNNRLTTVTKKVRNISNVTEQFRKKYEPNKSKSPINKLKNIFSNNRNLQLYSLYGDVSSYLSTFSNNISQIDRVITRKGTRENPINLNTMINQRQKMVSNIQSVSPKNTETPIKSSSELEIEPEI